MNRKTKKIILITVSLLVVLGVSSFFINRRKKKPNHILFMGGLDDRSGDLSIEEQKELLKKGLGENFSIDSYRYNDEKGILSAISKLNKSPYVVLFSKGGSKSKEVAEKLKEKDFDLSYLYVVEPYAKSLKTKLSVESAISLGMPDKNLIVGSSSSTGKGITDYNTLTPNCSPSHWCSLKEVGKIIADK